MTLEPTDKDQIGVALLSFAHSHQRAWGRVFSQRSDVAVVGVWDDDRLRGEEQAKTLGVDFFPDLAVLLERDDVHAVTICSENVKHADLAVQAARAGKHIMMQKPMATTVQDAQRIVRAVEEAQVTYMQAYNLRFDPLHMTVKELVDSGAIGKITIARRRHSHHFGLSPHDVENVLGWMARPELSGGGALMDEGVHGLLWFLWMFGRPLNVSAHMTTTMPHLTVEDNALLTFEFPNGILGTLQTSWTESAGGPTIEIYGDKGLILATGTDIASTRFMPEGIPPLQVFRYETQTWEYPQIEVVTKRAVPPPNAFIDTLISGAPSMVSAETAMIAVEMAVAAYESAQTGRRIPL